MKYLLRKEKPYFELARSGKRITHIAIAIPIIFVFIIAGGIFSQAFLYHFVFGNPQLEPLYRTFYQLTVDFSLIIFFLWLWIRFFEGRAFYTIGFTKQNALKKYFRGFLIGLGMLTVVVGTMAILGLINFDKANITFDSNTLWVVFVMLIGYMIQGASEEIIFRGWQLQVIGARYKPWLGILISSIIFALLHSLNSGVTIIAIVNIFLFGILLAFFVMRNNDIWAACGWHSAWNWAMASIYGLEVSGSHKIGSILNLSSSGPTYLSGGAFGPEASIITSVVLLTGIIIVIKLKPKKKLEIE